MLRQLPFLIGLLFSCLADAQDCHRGELAPPYCDVNHDWVADAPQAAPWLMPEQINFCYLPTSNDSIYKEVLKPFIEHLNQALQRPIVYVPCNSIDDVLANLKNHRLHLAAIPPGLLGYAVNLAGAVPFAARGTQAGLQYYHSLLIAKEDSGFSLPKDLKGKTIAHNRANSFSGFFAPRTLLQKESLPEYTPRFSGQHAKSILGVLSGDYAAAMAPSDVLDRLIERGHLRPEQVRILWKGPSLPTAAWVYPHTLSPELVTALRNAVYSFRLPPLIQDTFKGADRFVPIQYGKDWMLVREIMQSAGHAYSYEGFTAVTGKTLASHIVPLPAAAPPPSTEEHAIDEEHPILDDTDDILTETPAAPSAPAVEEE